MESQKIFGVSSANGIFAFFFSLRNSGFLRQMYVLKSGIEVQMGAEVEFLGFVKWDFVFVKNRTIGDCINGLDWG